MKFYKNKEAVINPWYEKLNFCLIWPLTLLLYGIHYLHNKL